MSRDLTPSPELTNGGPRRRRKGQTCLNCRRRKIRCDGIRPACGLCLGGNASFEDCEYPGDGPTMTQLLEQQISQVKSRIQVLEDPADDPSVALHHPYAPDTQVVFRSSSRNSSIGSDDASPHLSPKQRSPRNSESGSYEPFQEPLIHRRRELLDVFLMNPTHYGFFLDPGRFYQSMMLPNAIGDISRPSPGLLSAVYLWSWHISKQGPSEKTLLASTLYHLAKDLSGSHPCRVIHSIQAEVLLSYYYLKNGKMLEGNHHAHAAFSLVIASNLHRIRCPNGLQTSNQSLPPSSDAIEESERIDTLWAVVVLNNHWASIQEAQPSCSVLQTSEIDTPWPMDSVDQEYPMLPATSRATLQTFLSGRSVEGFSEKALHAKASVLSERAGSIHDGDKASILQSGSFSHLDSLIDTLHSSLSSINGSSGSPQSIHLRIITQMLLYAAMIKLHRPYFQDSEGSYHKVIFAAQAIARLTKSIPSYGTSINPTVGIIWSLACESLMPVVLSQTDNAELATSLNLMLSYLTEYSDTNILFGILLLKFQGYAAENGGYERQLSH